MISVWALLPYTYGFGVGIGGRYTLPLAPNGIIPDINESFEAEFGRHVALFHPLEDFPAARRRITDAGGELVEPLRSTQFERLFFREPINGYLFELIDRARHRQILEERS